MAKMERFAGSLRVLTVGLMLVGGVAPAVASDNGWIKPTPEELTMTSLPGYPGVPAVILNREEITKEDLHVMQHYERIKILTEKGKEKANVELSFATIHGDGYYMGDDKQITDIQGRTIHPDGTVIPFTGKPYLKQIVNNKQFSYQARVFTLPDVEVGSIIEYRYATRTSDDAFEEPFWEVQDDLYAKNVHFMWLPTTKELGSEEGMINTISYLPILPQGSEVKIRETPANAGGIPQKIFELTAHDIPPKPTEDHMPPVASFSYRVLFFYTPYRTRAEYWKARGKAWSKRADNFAGPNGDLKQATQTVIAGADTQEAKLQKIYQTVMAMDNTDYTREHGKQEDQASGLKKVSNSIDVYTRKRGSSTEIAELFVGMARAAGFKAYMMVVPNRSQRLFSPDWLSFQQFDNMIAIVNVDGKERFFDPGSRYCPFGHLAWESTFVQGVRQTDGGTDFAITPGNSYVFSKTERIGDLSLDEHGRVTGTLSITFNGSSALDWRQVALKSDEEDLRHGLKNEVQAWIPNTLEAKVTSIDNLTDYEKPLVAHYDVIGGMGSATGKRLILPMDIFLADGQTTFPHEKREMPVYFHYAHSMLDAVRLKYPASMTLEGAPAPAKTSFMDVAQYSVSSVTGANNITVRRNLLFNGVIVPLKDYPTLRSFYAEFEAKDKDSIVLKATPTTAAAN